MMTQEPLNKSYFEVNPNLYIRTMSVDEPVDVKIRKRDADDFDAEIRNRRLWKQSKIIIQLLVTSLTLEINLQK